MPQAPLRRYFKLPDDVITVDFVHQIDRAANTESIRKTLTDYEVTPSIGRNLEKALDNVRRGLADRRSIFTWIHGSFGCGKSHFMNVLSLLLADEKAVYAIHPELQAHRAKFAPTVIGQKLFRLHVQCISRDARTVEEIVLKSAVEELARLHPSAPAPAVFEAHKLFIAAGHLLADLGDEKFFAAFPSNKSAGDDPDWGDFGGARWNRARFEAAIAAPDSKDARDLAGELAKTPWLAGAAQSSEFVKLGPGLQILAEHLKGLGYQGVVLFLDELVLWLSTFQDPKKLALETPKVSTLVEHGDYPPSLPFLTFAARQRDLSEMVGKLTVGRDEVVFRDQLSFWKDRFDTIPLEDKDLPRIIEKRLLHSTGPEATAEIDAAFDSYKRTFAQDFRLLNGNQGDAADFRRVYPLSPALVEVMVALSATLQRDRTALRELTQLMVRYLPDFELGKVVPVGDLFDVVAHGQTSDLPVIQRLYEQARSIYESALLPHIRKKQKTDTPTRCQLLREDFDGRLGCSGCAEKACRTQTRIAKTVLLQGLVPNASVLKDLSASNLVYLNSGTLKSVVPNQEKAMVANLLRDWNGVTPAVHVTGEADPQVRVELDTVDVRRILDFCRDLDNQQRRRIRVREILFEKMGIALKDQMGSRTYEWRGRKWRVGVVYDNTRLANDNVFRPGEDEDLRLLLDYPFDEVGSGPRDDEERIAEVIDRLPEKDAARGLGTVVWLPSFVDEDTQDALKDLVVLDGLTSTSDQDLASRLPFISLDQLGRVKTTLDQQRDHKLSQVEKVLASAYGVNHQHDAHLAPGLSPKDHVHLIRRDSKLTVPAEGLFGNALESVLKQALETRASRHPVFGRAPTKARLEAVLEGLDRVLETPGRRARMDRSTLEDLRGIAGAEHLGIVRVIEEDAIYTGGILDQVAKNLASHKGPLSVGRVREALDPDGLMELSAEVEDFLVLAYARASARPLKLLAHGNATVGLIGKLPDDTALVPVELPGQEAWQKAHGAAGLLGITTAGKALTPTRVDELAALVRKAAEDIGVARVVEAQRLIQEWYALSGQAEPVESTARWSVLESLRRLVSAALIGGDSREVVEEIARFEWDPARTTALTYIASGKRLDGLNESLRSDHLRTTLGTLCRLELDPARRDAAAPGIGRLRAALAADENVIELRSTLGSEAAAALATLIGGGPPPPPPPRKPSTPPEPPIVTIGVVPPVPRQATEHFTLRAEAEVEDLARKLRELLESGADVHVTIEVIGKVRS